MRKNGGAAAASTGSRNAASSLKVGPASSGQGGLLPAPIESMATTRWLGASRSISTRHCDDVLALEWRQTTAEPWPASRTNRTSVGIALSDAVAPIRAQLLASRTCLCVAAGLAFSARAVDFDDVEPLAAIFALRVPCALAVRSD